MSLVPVSALLEGGLRKRQLSYQSGRRAEIGFDISAVKERPRIKKKWRDKPGRKLIARTPYASKTRWRQW